MGMFIQAWLWTWLLLAVVIVCVWIIFLWQDNPGIIDVFWSFSIALAGSVHFLSRADSLPADVFLGLLWLWALRLSGHLFWTRILPGTVELRYEQLSQRWRWSRRLGFLLNFQLQAFFASVMAFPCYFIAQLTPVWQWPSLFALVLISLGLIGETIADHQLAYFKKHRLGRVCNIGCWRYSRHPNYFFEWLIWVGFALAGTTAPYGLLGAISPILLWSLMHWITAPITEQTSLRTRGDAYRYYQSTTNQFFPWWPKDSKT